MLVHIHLLQLRFSYGLRSSRSLTLPGSVSRSCPDSPNSPSAQSPFALCRSPLLRGDLLLHLRGHYPSFFAPTDSCASPKPSLLLRLLTSSMGLCRSSPVPAGSWTFPVLSPPFFPWVSGPLPRWAPMVPLPVSSHGNIGLLQPLNGSAFPLLSRSATSQRGFHFGAAAIPLCSNPQVCSPPWSLPPQPSRLGSCDFYIRASHGSLPPHAPDMLNARIGQLTLGDFHPTRSAALPAATSG